MKIIYGTDIFQLHKNRHTIGITINSQITTKGLVMGKGIALQCKKMYPQIPNQWADIMINMFPAENYTFYDRKHNLLAVQTKNHWRNPSNVFIIEKSLVRLIEIANYWMLNNIYLPPLGCGNGGLDWDNQVRPLMESKLDDRFTVVFK